MTRYFPIGILCFLFGSFSLVSAQTGETGSTTNTPKYSNEFLRIGVGARAFGMGNAQVAAANDVTAGYWNPAGLASPGTVPYPEVSLMHASYFAGIADYSYIGFTMPVDSASDKYFGVSVIRMGIDDIPNTLQLIDPDGSFNYSRVTSFSETQLAALVSYAWQPVLIEGLNLGFNVKIIYRGVGRFANAWGFGVDLGARYQRGPLSLAAVLTDATHTYNAWTFNTETFAEEFAATGNIVPTSSVELTRPALRVGLAYDISLARKAKLLLALDSDVYFDGRRPGSVAFIGNASVDPRLGAEFALLNQQYRKVAFLRGGVYNIQNILDSEGNPVTGLFPTIGVGVVLRNFTLDYALANIGNLSENLHTHIVSLKFHIQ
ncbi:MAG: PorV/PorQ family protein [Bacteroidia bacterium]|nr:PorV/PorQ family protein [Bacteroidia bacterium]